MSLYKLEACREPTTVGAGVGVIDAISLGFVLDDFKLDLRQRGSRWRCGRTRATRHRDLHFRSALTGAWSGTPSLDAQNNIGRFQQRLLCPNSFALTHDCFSMK